MNVDVLTVSSKVQIALPDSVRNALSIAAGDKIVAYSSGDSILLKKLELPTEDEFSKWLDNAQKVGIPVGADRGRRTRNHLRGEGEETRARTVIDAGASLPLPVACRQCKALQFLLVEVTEIVWTFPPDAIIEVK